MTRARHRGARSLQRLDPETDHLAIHRAVTATEFPWDYGRGLECAILRTCCVPSIASVLDRSGEFRERALKRYDDTRILLGEIVAGGYESDRGRCAIRQINRAHAPYRIDNDDMLYVLSTFVFEPARWIDRWAWRRMSAVERDAGFHFFRQIGRRMGVRDLPSDPVRFEEFNRRYERERFRRTPSSERLATDLLDLYASFHRQPLRRAARALLPARLDPASRAALGLPEPCRPVRAANGLLLRGHGAAELVAPRATARLFRRPAARSYPCGYDVASIGPSQGGTTSARHADGAVRGTAAHAVATTTPRGGEEGGGDRCSRGPDRGLAGRAGDRDAGDGR